MIHAYRTDTGKVSAIADNETVAELSPEAAEKLADELREVAAESRDIRREVAQFE